MIYIFFFYILSNAVFTQEVLRERSNNADPKEGLQMQSKSIKKLSYKIEEALYQKFPAIDGKYQKKFRTILFNLKVCCFIFIKKLLVLKN